MIMTMHWEVTLRFGRRFERKVYKSKEEAMEAIRISVFNNRDSVSCSIEGISVEEPSLSASDSIRNVIGKF